MTTSNGLDFGDLLRRQRRLAGLTQEELAAQATISVRAISDLERGLKYRPRKDTVQLLADALALRGPERIAFEEAARWSGRPPRAPSARGTDLPASTETEESKSVRLPTGAFLGSLPTAPLVARDREMGEVLSAMDAVLAGNGQTVLLVGEPGVGKTRLAQEVTLQLRQRGFLVGVGRCYDATQAIPYYPFLGALSTLHAMAPDDVRKDAARRWPHLGAVLPDYLSAPDETGAPDQQHRIFRAVASYLMAVADAAPVALLLDDLHWADSTSLRLLHHLARETRTSRIFFLATCRDVGMGKHPALEDTLQELDREQLRQRISVRCLDPAGTAQLIGVTLGEVSDSAELANLVHSRTEGNPFFIQQVVQVLVERGELYRESEHWNRKAVDELSVPKSIRSAIGQRLSRLHEETQQILREASVLGQVVDFRDLEVMSGRHESSLEAALDEAAAAGLVRELDPDTFAFDHVLTQQGLYADLSARKRRRLHLAAGEAIERLPEARRTRRAAELARHFLQGDDPTRAVPYLLQAGMASYWVMALDEAIGQYRAALKLIRETDDRRQEASTMVWLGVILGYGGYDDESLALLEAGVAQAEADNDISTVIQGMNYLTHRRILRGELERGREYHERAVHALDEIEDPWAVSLALLWMGWVLWWLGEWTEARTYSERALQTSQNRAFDLSLGCRIDLARLSLAEGDWVQARLCLQENLSQDEARADPGMVLYSHWLLGKLELLEGHAEAARARIESVYGDRRLQWESRTEVLPILGETYLALGDVDKAGEIAAESVALARDHEYMLALVGALDVQGTVRFVQGRWEEAEALFDEAVSLAHPMPYPYGEALVLYHWGLMHLERQDRDRAQDRLAAAQVIFRRLGARPDLERAEQALARLSTPR